MIYMATKELNEKQLKAIELLIKGESINDIAATLGVTRQSVSTWKNKDEMFKAEMDKCVQELKSKVSDKLLMNIEPLMDKLIKIALKSSSEKTSLDACIYALNRLCGTPTNKIADVTNATGNDKDVNILSMLEEINNDNVVLIDQAK